MFKTKRVKVNRLTKSGFADGLRQTARRMREVPTGGSVPDHILDLYEIYDWRNAVHVLSGAHPKEWQDVLQILGSFRLRKSHIIAGGKGKSEISKTIDSAFYARGWREHEFRTTFAVDGKERSSRTHKIDCLSGLVGLEIEWNSKDQTFVRDLNNFRVLFDLQVLDVGIIVTRTDDLQKLFNFLGVGSKYGASTTHIGKLLPRLASGGGGGCPVLVFGLTQKLYDPSS